MCDSGEATHKRPHVVTVRKMHWLYVFVDAIVFFTRCPKLLFFTFYIIEIIFEKVVAKPWRWIRIKFAVLALFTEPKLGHFRVNDFKLLWLI